MYDMKPCSVLAEAKIKTRDDIVGTEGKFKEKYPYSNLPIGYCFCVPLDEIKNELSLRSMVSAKGKSLGKKFCVIKHDDPYNCYEVARLA